MAKRRTKLETMQALYEKMERDVLQFGMAMPRAEEIEASLLGSILLDPSALAKVTEVFGERTTDELPFYRDTNRQIFEACLALDQANEPIDLATVANRLEKMGADKAEVSMYLVELTGRVVTTANVQAHAKILIEKHAAREVIRICEESKLRAYQGEDDAFDLLEAIEGETFRVRDAKERGHRTMRAADELVTEAFVHFEEMDRMRREHGYARLGIDTGLSALTSLTNGWKPGDVIVLAARPSMGKTALALKFALAAATERLAADEPNVVVIFSLEMTAQALMVRMACQVARVDMDRAKKGMLTDEEWRALNHARTSIAALPIMIDDSPGLTVAEIGRRLKRVAQRMRRKVALAIVDHIQLVRPPEMRAEASETDIVRASSRQLKSLAKQTGGALMVLSQLNRALESRPNKRPMMSDLRASGALEEDADIILALYRGEYYNEPVDPEGQPTAGVLEINTVKNRDGQTGMVRAQFDKTTGAIEDWIPQDAFAQMDDSF